MSEKILVTGAAGFVGRHLVRSLKEKGHDVIAMVRENTDTGYFDTLGVRTVKADLRVPKSIAPALKGVDKVVHLATTMKGPWEEYEEGTVNGTRRLAEASRKAGVQRMIFVSSIAVYDAIPAEEAKVSEETPLLTEGLSNYERSKIEAEQALAVEREAGLNTVVLRCGVIYGPGGPLFPPRLGFGGEGRYIVIGDGTNQIPVVYVNNFVAAIERALDPTLPSGAVFNIVDDLSLTQDEYLQAVKTHVVPGMKIQHVSYNTFLKFANGVGWILSKMKRPSPLRPSYIYLCSHPVRYGNERARQQLKWVSPVKTADALRETMEYFAAQRSHPRLVDYKKTRGHIRVSQSYNVAMVGCGVIARTHLDILKKIDNVTVVAVCDQNAEAAEALATEYGIRRAYASVEEMLEKVEVHAVHVMTPPQGRVEIVRQAAAKGCHIFLEKPMAVDADEARQIQDAVQAGSVQLCMGHNHLFDPPMIEARRLIAKGEVGKICYVESWYGFNLGANLASRYMVPGAEKHWSMHIPGKLYQNLFSHPYSVLSDVMGDPEEIKAVATSAGVVKSMRSDELKVFVRNGGATGLITVSLAVNPRYQYLNIYGTNMCLYIDFLNKTLIKHTTPKGVPKAISRALMSIVGGLVMIGATFRNVFKVATKSFTYFDGTETLIKEFYRRLADGSPMPVSVEEGVKSMEVMDEVWKQVKI